MLTSPGFFFKAPFYHYFSITKLRTCTRCSALFKSILSIAVRSCSDLQTCDASYGDDEYWLYPAPYGTTRTKVYCDGMSGSTPKEYISGSENCLVGCSSLFYISLDL